MYEAITISEFYLNRVTGILGKTHRQWHLLQLISSVGAAAFKF